MLLVWILGFSLLGAAVSVLAAGLFLSFSEGLRQRVLPHLVGYAVGTLLGAAFLGLLPRALAGREPATILGTALAGMLAFFLLEKALIWRHCHLEECDVHETAAPLILAGDAVHNFLDGIVIAAAFLGSVPLGIATGLAVVVHEMPQEVGDVAILLHGGLAPRKALVWNALASLSIVPGALLGYAALSALDAVVPVVQAIAAASFIYIASADLIPSLHRSPANRGGLVQVLLMFAGVGTVALLQGH